MCTPDPKPTTWKSKKYLKWIRKQPCSYCGQKSDHAHHLIGRGNMSGMGMTAPDLMALPVCASCHNILHRGSDPAALDYQWEMICRTVLQAVDEGTLKC